MFLRLSNKDKTCKTLFSLRQCEHSWGLGSQDMFMALGQGQAAFRNLSVCDPASWRTAHHFPFGNPGEMPEPQGTD